MTEDFSAKYLILFHFIRLYIISAGPFIKAVCFITGGAGCTPYDHWYGFVAGFCAEAVQYFCPRQARHIIIQYNEAGKFFRRAGP
jgi:hypothetical protein